MCSKYPPYNLNNFIKNYQVLKVSLTWPLNLLAIYSLVLTILLVTVPLVPRAATTEQMIWVPPPDLGPVHRDAACVPSTQGFAMTLARIELAFRQWSCLVLNLSIRKGPIREVILLFLEATLVTLALNRWPTVQGLGFRKRKAKKKSIMCELIGL